MSEQNQNCLDCFNCKATIELPRNWRQILDEELLALQNASTDRKRRGAVRQLSLSVTGKLVRCIEGRLRDQWGMRKSAFVLARRGGEVPAWAVRSARACGAFDGEGE